MYLTSPNKVFISYSLLCTPDPAFAPATGTPEPGGWSMREMKRLLRGLTGLNLMYVFANRDITIDETQSLSGADIVEVAPAYDHGKSRWSCTCNICLNLPFSRHYQHRRRGHCPRFLKSLYRQRQTCDWPESVHGRELGYTKRYI
jgi:Arginase family